MRIVSWNVHRCVGMDRHYRPERVVEALRRLDGDVIALQEMDSSLRTAEGLDPLSYIARELKMQAVMGPTLNRDYGAYGNAVLTRLEIVSSEEHDLSFRRYEPRGALAVQLRDADGRRFRVVNTHLGLTYWERSFQIDRLLARCVWAELPGPDGVVILTGDFNEWFPWTGNNLRLSRSFDVCSRRSPTFPSSWPRLALDRIFISGRVRELRVSIPRDETVRVVSDHLPLIGDIEP